MLATLPRHQSLRQHQSPAPKLGRRVPRVRRRIGLLALPDEPPPCRSPGYWAASSRVVRPTSCACCGGSTRSTTPAGSTQTISERSATSSRFPRPRRPATAASSTSTAGQPLHLRDRAVNHAIGGASASAAHRRLYSGCRRGFSVEKCIGPARPGREPASGAVISVRGMPAPLPGHVWTRCRWVRPHVGVVPGGCL